MAWAQNLLGFCFFACASQTPFSWVWPGGLQASKSHVAQRFALRFRMAWARFVIVVERWGIWRWRPSMGLLSLCAPVGTASPTAPRACFSWKLPATVTKALFFMGSKGLFSGFQKRRFGIFQAAVSQWLGHKTCWGSAFSHARPKHVFHGFCLVACGLSSLTLRRLPCLKQLFSLFLVGSKSNVSAFFWLRFRMAWALFFVFSGFQKRRFGIFPAAVSQWLGHKTCWGAAFSHARPKHLFLEFGLVACRLPSLTLRKGLPCSRQLFFFVFSLAGVLHFRMRVPSTLFMGFVWWLAGFQVLRCAKVCLAWSNFFLCF